MRKGETADAAEHANHIIEDKYNQKKTVQDTDRSIRSGPLTVSVEVNGRI